MGEHAQDAVGLAVEYEFFDEDEEECMPSAWGFGYLGPRLPRLKTCNRCGAKNLFWKSLPEGWRLHGIGPDRQPAKHVCSVPTDDRNAE